jgi:two-component system C4-dicarboxylate transport sensor histidine kinase DctB
MQLRLLGSVGPRLAAVAALAAILGWSGFLMSQEAGIAALEDKGRQRLELYEASLEREIEKYAYFPATLGLVRDVLDLVVLGGPERAQAMNLYLEQLNQRAGSLSIYVLDGRGHVVASSNWNRPDSYVGEDLTYRTYTTEALAGRPARLFGIGTTRGEPGYYFSSPLTADGRVVGVAVVKVGLETLETSWATVEAPVFVTDENGIVILASVASWKFSALRPLSAEVKAGLTRSLQYNAHDLPPLGLATVRTLEDGAHLVDLPGPKPVPGEVVPVSGRFLAQSVPLDAGRWSMTVLSPLGEVRTIAATRGALAGVGGAALGLLAIAWSQHRARLVERQRARETLQRAHDELERKVEERTKNLRAAQDELVHAAKLAVIGQMSAGIAHELNQPLAALHTLSDNTIAYLERGDLGEVRENLVFVVEMVQRMATLTTQLKSFARKSSGEVRPVSIARAVDNALLILRRRLEADRVVPRLDISADALVACDQVRLEQVLVNLVANALDAMAGAAEKRLEIAGSREGERVVVTLRDGGPGLSGEAKSHLFEPFFTTKASGDGLGLGLAISSGIVHDFGGTLTGSDHPEGGAVFRLDLPAATEEGA